LAVSEGFTAGFICGDRGSPDRFAKISFGGSFSASLSGSLGVFENHGAAVVQMDFRCFPCRRLVEPVWVRLIRIPGTVEPVKIGFFVGDPFLDRLRRRHKTARHKTEDRRRRGLAQITGCDAHRDAVTSDSFACRQSPPMKSRVLVLRLVSWSLESIEEW